MIWEVKLSPLSCQALYADFIFSYSEFTFGPEG